MRKFFDMKIAEHEVSLPIFRVSDDISIAAFILFDYPELTMNAAAELIEKCPYFDVIVTPEAKSIPLAYEMSRQCGKPYIVVRKAKKLYMSDVLETTVKSITTLNTQKLFLSGNDVPKLSNKKVLIVDDVISTGESLNAVRELVESADGNVCGVAAVLAEGDAAKRTDIVYLEKLPLF